MLEGSQMNFECEHLVYEMFDCFDEVVCINSISNTAHEIKASEKFSYLHGLSDAASLLKQFRDSVYPDDIKKIEQFNLCTGQKINDEIRCKNTYGTYHWCCCQFISLNEESYLIMLNDLSEKVNEGSRLKNEYLRKQLADNIKNQIVEQRYQAIINHTDIMMFEYDVKKRTLSFNMKLNNILQFAPETEYKIEDFLESGYIFENDRRIFDSIIEKLNLVKCTSAEIRFKSKSGEYLRYSVSFYGIYDIDGTLCMITGLFNNIIDECKNDSVNYDLRTGLINAESFGDKLEKIISSDSDNKYAVVFFDIERFKTVNELYGIEFADDIIKFIAFNLEYMFNSENCFATHLSMDCFCIFMPYSDDEEITGRIKQLDKKINYYKYVSLKYAYGVCKITDKSMKARIICDNAHMAEKSVKGNHINNIAFYNADIKKKAIENISIENDMENALNKGEFLMYLQPKYNIERHEIVGAEALVRWDHSQKGMIMPGKFIPLFEKNGFIIKLDEYIWEQACLTIRKWIDCGIKPIPVSVNVSRVNISNPSLVSILDGLIEKYSIDKKYLELEITESVYYDDQQNLTDVLLKLKKSGYTLLMDDFGSGFSSLNMLKNTPFDALKIDKNFLNETMLTEKGKKIIMHTICLSKDIGMDIVAEGVETKAQAEYLLECGCNVAQGYYYSKPVSADIFEKEFLK